MTQSPIILPSPIAALEPKEVQRVLKNVGERFAERWDKDRKKVRERGALGFEILPPRERFAAFMAETLEADLPYVFDSQFAAKRQAGDQTLLESERLIAQQMQLQTEYEMKSQLAMQMGAEPPPPPLPLEQIPMLWPGLLMPPMMPDDWEFYSKLFVQLYAANFEKEGMFP